MSDYLDVLTFRKSIEDTYKDAVEMYAHIVKYNMSSKDWQRALECVIEIDSCLDYVSKISECANKERDNSIFMDVYAEFAKMYNNNSNVAFAVLFEIIVETGGTL